MYATLGTVVGGFDRLRTAYRPVDQPFNAARVAAAGAGVALATGQPTAATLRRALVRVLGEQSFRLAARRISQEIALLPSVDEAPAVLERLGARH